MSRRTSKKKTSAISFILLLIAVIGYFFLKPEDAADPAADAPHAVSVSQVPAYKNTPYAVINDGQPLFTEKEITDDSYEKYGGLDKLGRCTVTMACIGRDLMPKEDRGDISSVKPTGWVQGRCHLIGFQLAGENANEQNLITGTRYMNVEGMLPFENMVADYVRETGNHVMYRVTPIFEGDNLVASGVQMEAYSVEDQGEGVCFHVYVYNVQPGVYIDYATGENRVA